TLEVAGIERHRGAVGRGLHDRILGDRLAERVRRPAVADAPPGRDAARGRVVRRVARRGVRADRAGGEIAALRIARAGLALGADGSRSSPSGPVRSFGWLVNAPNSSALIITVPSSRIETLPVVAARCARVLPTLRSNHSSRLQAECERLAG